MREKRLKYLWCLLACGAVFLGIMIFRISFFKKEAYSQSVAMQRTESISIKKNRGIFCDRNMIPLVDASPKTYGISENGTITEKDENISIRLAERYGKSSLATHLIGYIDADGNGVSGLEKCFDKVLQSDGEYKLNVITTASGEVAKTMGAGLVEEDEKVNSVKLTIDSHIQKISETALSKSGFNGAVVVMDVKNSDILAMASYPEYDRNKVYNHVDSKGSELVNRAISAYNAGSIFKIITLASALENKVADGMYTCVGKLSFGTREFNCHNHLGHGVVDFENAFSKSCNCAFYEMGIKTGAEKILETARNFGIGEKLLCYDNLEESKGNLPQKTDYGIFETVNFSIGQGEILITPVQAANMVCIIANNGIANCVNLADGIIDANGRMTRNLREIHERRVVDFDIARILQKCMRLAVTDGTALGANSDIVQIAGKTGTAETGWVENGEILVHGWFCGYFPYDNPKYAMAVFMENGRSGSESAVPVFKKIAEEIINFYPMG